LSIVEAKSSGSKVAPAGFALENAIFLIEMFYVMEPLFDEAAGAKTRTVGAILLYKSNTADL
jgi:hypothetical protein